MSAKRLPRPLRRLRGKLTLSYTLTSVLAFLFVEILVIGTALLIASANVPALLLNDLKQEAPQATPYFIHGTPDREALQAWLHIVEQTIPNPGPYRGTKIILLAVVDTHGQVIAALGSRPLSPGTPLQDVLSARNRANLHAVLSDTHGTTSEVDADAQHIDVAITPIVGNNGQVQGALSITIIEPDKLQALSGFAQLIIFSTIFLTILGAIAGTIFGSLAARGITRRLKGLSAAAERWSRGDFSALTHDTSEDELGQVGRQLNNMAEQLQNLFQTRQKLATLEERNRLARDLHDSVKQQVFAISMQIGATKFLLRSNVDAAESRLLEAERLVQQAQQELTSLIRELRPIALEGKGLVDALRELVTQWAQQTEIVANLHVEGSSLVPQNVEEAIFRVAQEALSNVARHGKATQVQLTLTITEEQVTLTVADNGQGFAMGKRQDGVGLHSMRERMQALGGRVSLESSPGKGTRVVAQSTRLGVSSSEASPIATSDNARMTAPIQDR